MRLIFVMGPTNAGKTRLMEAAKAAGHGTVEVGKLLRAKYPPSYFEGQAAPKKTQVEAWSLMLEGIREADNQGLDLCFIDGQPRDMQQAAESLGLPYPKDYILIWAPADVRRERAVARDSADPAKLELSLRRLETDLLTGYDVLAYIGCHATIRFFDTTRIQQEEIVCRISRS